MKANYCSNCGETLKEFAVVCPNCGRPVPEANRSEQTNEKRQTKETVHAEKMQSTPQDTLVKTKSTFFALILSFFFPGLGQVYNGRAKKGVVFFVAIFISSILFIFSPIIFSPIIISALRGLYIIWILVLILPLVILIIWIWGLYDAYKDAERINKGEKPYREVSEWEVVSFLILPIILSVLLAVILAILLFALLLYMTTY